MIVFNTFDGFLSALQTMPYNTELGRAIYDFTRDDSNSLRFAEAINDGFELRPEIVDASPFSTIFPGLLQQTVFGNSPKRFSDDTKFTSTRFAVMTSKWGSWGPTSGGVVPNAASQLKRMFAAGRAVPDIRYYTSFKKNAEQGKYQFARIVLPAHFNYYRRQMLRNGQQPGAEVREVKDAAALTKFLDHSFHNIWLPSAAVDSAEIKDAMSIMSPSLLRELYSDVWEGGYEAHHARMQAKANT